ncbi:TetR/AcrR family transcriptional regulator [Pseudoclavibacter sp. AY1F1]|uniref:TetR/AcrR family transcriptional regulator n=1 Tax=Pseudoclavibacter sp. AY1F1 TaxID=2080583 RepID=UPI000CE903A9|nr:TetR/AcrR family transcriptional regulator [Pseudoclavibacter sp. AY1F1]PPF44919.1 TetR/AcrR family transcriptional regulator [Pseudoclavibacter sp. AY1F1]
MARTTGFDRQDAVAGARTLFWRRGYDSASTSDIEAATGLSRSSIYNTFGSKRGLFDAAIQSYLDEVVHPLLSPLRADQISNIALDDYLSRLSTAALTQDRRDDVRGCLLLATASSSLAEDPAIRASITDYRATLEHAITRGTQHLGHADPMGTLVTAAVVGALTIARVDGRAAADALEAARALIRA